MEISEGLQKLIDAALVDGKISKSERVVLLKRSEKEGIDEGEFGLYLDSLLHHKKSANGSEVKNIIEKGKTLWNSDFMNKELTKTDDGKTIKIKHLSLLFGGFGLMILLLLFMSIFEDNESNKAGDKSVTEKLEQYDFSGARKDASSLKCDNLLITDCPRTVLMVKIIKEEVTYMASNKEYSKAINAMSDVNTLMLFDKLVENGKISQNRDEFSKSLKKIIIDKAKVNGDIDLQEIKNLK